MHLQSIKISPDVNEISENVDINQQNQSYFLKESVKAFYQTTRTS
jgi:hypothetical protein